MLRAGHFLHPVRTARSAYGRLRRAAYRRIAAWQLRKCRRETRDRCWCGGELRPCKWHRGYGVCADCGCHVNLRPLAQEELARLYSFGLYWHVRQKMKGHPSIEQRAEHDRLDGRVDYWLGLVERYCPPAGQIVEVGCGHGVLLGELARRGYRCTGLEVDEKVAAWACERTNVDIRWGLFPGVQLPECDLFMAFDVIEHVSRPDEFMRAAAALLRPGGAAIIQTPIERYGYEPPFGERFTAAFDEVEHLFLFTDLAMRELAARSGLEIVSCDDRLWLHHEICVFRKP